MINTSIKQIFRNLKKNRSFTLINLLGLSLGVASVVILFLIYQYEEGFDSFHSRSENIYRVVSKVQRDDQQKYNASVPFPTGKFLREKAPDITATQINFSDEMQVQIGKQDPFLQEDIIFADSLFFEVLNFEKIDNFWISGNSETALEKPNTAVITNRLAKEYFGESNAVGQLIRLDNSVDVEIVGVVEDISGMSHLPLNLIVSYSTLNEDLMDEMPLDSWSFTSGGYSYVRLKEGGSTSSLDDAFQEMVDLQSTPGEAKKQEIYLQPLKEIHFDPNFDNSNYTYTVSPRYLNMLLFLGAFILLIACVNYVNLSTSFAFTKSKEVGIRKTIGASRKQLFFHYLFETFVVTLLASIIGFVIALLSLPTVNNILGKSIALNDLFNFQFLLALVAVVLLVSFISGFYPAIILSGFNPINSLKNRFTMPGKSSVILRKGLVIFQFTTSIVLIICTLVISRQMEYFQNKELGFNKEAVIEVRLPESDSLRRESFRTLLQEQVGVQEISFCFGAPISGSGLVISIEAPQLPKGQYSTKLIPADKNYMETYELELLAGRWFLSSEEKNIGSAVVINRSLAKTLGYKNPEEALGNSFEIGINSIRPTVVGVTEDFHTSSLHEDIPSVALTPYPYFYIATGIKISKGDVRPTLAAVEDAWRKIYPENVYEMAFIDETLAESYEQETKNYQIFKAFSIISILICCMGLWGLISFVVIRKTKEIGIRKVLGASVSGIVILLSKDFLLLIAIALLIASPLAWYFMEGWLQDFAYRVDISWFVFAAAGFFAILIAFITISFQTIKAGRSNPVKNLRTE